MNDREQVVEDLEEVLMSNRDDWGEAASAAWDQVVAPLLAEAWDEGRAALQAELGRTWSIYDAGDPTPNPYRVAEDRAT